MGRVFVIGLDGYESSIAERMMQAGELPALKELREQSARFELDHGPAKRTGLAWEHVSSGLTPENAKRWSAVYFNPETYEVEQKGAIFAPFPLRMNKPTVIFDVPYFDLTRAPNVNGITAWGAHDPGAERISHPASLLNEVLQRFGSYPATKWIYGLAWPSAKRSEQMGNALTQAVNHRAEITRWLFCDRFTDWDLGMVVVSELHSVIEGLWHGIDASHPLHNHASAPAAGSGIRNVYKAVDKLVEIFSKAFEDCNLIVFSMHGMGPNQSDIPGMVLLPELLHRYAFGKSFFHQPQNWSDAPDGIPILNESDDWKIQTPLDESRNSRILRRVKKTLGLTKSVQRSNLWWMPAARYQRAWHKMPAFALPSYYDGSIRINLSGRERFGSVPLSDYSSFCSEIMNLMNHCRNPITGESVVDHFIHYGDGNPRSLHPTQGDLIVIWNGSPLAFDHPRFGRIGPVPFRRPGGHTGSSGIAYIRSAKIPAGDYGMHSSFDIVPTIFHLMDQPVPEEINGNALTEAKKSMLKV